MRDELKYAVSGLLAGLANGFFGAGGGMFLVPLFCRWVKMDEKRAFATSLAIVLPLSVISAIVYLKNGVFDIRRAFPFLVGGLVGGSVGGAVFKKVPASVLRIALSLFIIYGGVRALFAI